MTCSYCKSEYTSQEQCPNCGANSKLQTNPIPVPKSIRYRRKAILTPLFTLFVSAPLIVVGALRISVAAGWEWFYPNTGRVLTEGIVILSTGILALLIGIIRTRLIIKNGN